MTVDDDNDLLAEVRAKAMDDVRARHAPPLRAPASLEVVAAAESLLGFALHPFVKRVYVEVADGGFGPGHGLVSLVAEGDELSLPAVYRAFREGDSPTELLPLWDWGDAAWSCVDRTDPDGNIVTHDDVAGATQTSFNLRSWFAAWARGVDMWQAIYLDREVAILNPFTKKLVPTKVRGHAKGTPYKKRAW